MTIASYEPAVTIVRHLQRTPGNAGTWPYDAETGLGRNRAIRPVGGARRLI
jgi:hypothetical protein